MKGILRSIGSASVLAGIGLVVFGEFGIGAATSDAKSTPGSGWCSQINDGQGWIDNTGHYLTISKKWAKDTQEQLKGICSAKGEYVPAGANPYIAGTASYTITLRENIDVFVGQESRFPDPQFSYHVYKVNSDTAASCTDGTTVSDGSCLVTEVQLLTDDHVAGNTDPVTKTPINGGTKYFRMKFAGYNDKGYELSPQPSFSFTVKDAGYYIYTLGTCVTAPGTPPQGKACSQPGAWQPLAAGAIRVAAAPSVTTPTPTPMPTATPSPKLPVTHASPSPTAKVAGAQAVNTPETGAGSYGPSLGWGLAFIVVGLGCLAPSLRRRKPVL